MPEPPEQHTAAAPRVAVLLATHNGIEWLPDQLATILDQRDVTVRIIASDDGSVDGTREWLVERAARDDRITVLPANDPTGSAAANFYRLIRDVALEPDELVAFADQDDLWLPGKLSRHAALLAAGHDAVSSDVTAFDERGRRTLVRKSFPQREFDYLLESPGPGSTFLLSRRLFEVVRGLLLAGSSEADQAAFHDCLVYAVGRARGWSWHIDDRSSVDYRQHRGNALGANLGLRSAVARWRLIRSRWHRSQAIVLATVGVEIADASVRPGLERIREVLLDRRLGARWRLARNACRLRRRPRDRWIIGALITIGVW